MKDSILSQCFRAGRGRFMGLAVLASALASSAHSAPQIAPASVAQPISPASVDARATGAKIPQPTHPLDAHDLETWLDGMLPAALKQGQVAGVVVSVVKDGHVLLAKGYGYADMNAKVPMDAQRSLVRPGSTSKLFTWTAVMQLVAQNKLDLNADVNRYLDFKIPERFGRPVTLNDLMTHRGGFEEGLKDAIVIDPKELPSLGAFLKGHLRPTLFPPSTVPAYSNWGTALAGYIVERVSGERFEDYVARHIFAPLEMTSSTFRQPLPAALAGRMSKGYVSSADKPKPFELISFAPAGALTSSATDMANFMIAHLNDGQFGSSMILAPETARLMHSASRPHPPGFDTIAHGFFLEQRNGRTVLEHGGDTIFFHSDLQLIPQEQVGIFVSFNSRGQGDSAYGMRTRLLEGFMDRYFPAAAPVTPPATATAEAHGQEIAGRYETSRRVQTGFMSLFYVLQGQEKVAVNPDATISISSSPDKHFREVAPYRWQEEGGSRVLLLQRPDGRKTILDSHNPVEIYQATPLRRSASFNLTIFTVSLLVLIATALVWPLAESARRYYRQASRIEGRALFARRVVRIAVVADLAYLFAWFLMLKPILGNEVSFYTTALDPLVRTMQVASIIPLLGAVAGIWNAVLAIRSRPSLFAKAGSVIIAAALLGVLWIAVVGGLTSYTLNY